MGDYFVAIGDSFTAGIGDEVEGIELRSWAEHFAHLYASDIQYANLAKRGLITKEIRAGQLEKALDLQPTMVSIIAGANDILKGRWNQEEYKTEMTLMIDEIAKSGATILIGTLPDFTVRIPMPEEHKQLIHQQLLDANEIIHSLSEKFDTYIFDFWNHPLSKDDTFWSKDHIHPNSKGYREIAKILYQSFTSAKNSK